MNEKAIKETLLMNKQDVDEVELVLTVPSPKSSIVGLSIRLSKGLSETTAIIFN